MWHMSAGCVMVDWRVPSACGKVFAEDLKRRVGHRLYLPLAHRLHVRQGRPTSRATLVFVGKEGVLDCVIIPDASWPSTRGDCSTKAPLRPWL